MNCECFQKVAQRLPSQEKVTRVLKRTFPVTTWLRQYKLSNLRYDIVAGLTVGLTLVPQCMAYVSMANLRPEFGLYSAFLGQFVYFFLGTSKDASIGPAAIVSMITGHVSARANPLYEDGDATCATILALIGGVILFAIGVLKFGFIVNLFSIPVVSGFTTAAGITIAGSQLAPLLGLPKKPFEMPGVFVKQINFVVRNIHNVKPVDVIIGLTALSFLLLMQSLPKMFEGIVKLHRVCRKKQRHRQQRDVEVHTPPQANGKPDDKASRSSYNTCLEVLRFLCACKNIIVFVVSTSVAYVLCRDYGSAKAAGITVVGYIKPGMPEFSVPRFDVAEMRYDNITNTTSEVILSDVKTTLGNLTVGFIVVPVMVIMEMFAILKALGRKNGYRVDARQELMAVGIANVVTSFLGGVPVTAAVTRCALNDQCHVRSQLASLLSASIVIVAINALTPVFYYIPKATLAAIITVAALNLVDFMVIPDVWRHCRSDAFMLVFTLLVCVFFEISYGVIICLSLNALLLLRSIAQTQLHISRKHPSSTFSFGDTEHHGSLVIVKLSHGLKYPSADKFLDKIAALLEKESHLIIDCTFVQSVDYTGVQAFRSLLLSSVQKGLHIVFANLNEEVHKEFEKLGLDHFHMVSSVEAAIGEYNKAVVISEMEAAAATSEYHQRPAFATNVSVDASAHTSFGQIDTSTADLVPDSYLTIAGNASASEAKRLRDERLRRRLLRELSVQPHFYGDLPLMVGNVDLGGGSPDDDQEQEFDNDAFEAHDEQTTPTASSSSRGTTPKQHKRALSEGRGRLSTRRQPHGNVQFLNTVLLHEVAQRSAIRQPGTPGLLETLQQRRVVDFHRHGPSAIEAISEAPAIEFIDIGSPDKISPVITRACNKSSNTD